MSYEVVLPPDTQNEIVAFVEDNYVGRAEQLAAADAIETELLRLSSVTVRGRSALKFTVAVGDRPPRVVEATYKVLEVDKLVVVFGFARVPPIAL